MQRKLLLIVLGTFAGSTALAVDENPAYEDRHAFFERMIETLPGSWEGAYADGSYEHPTSEWKPIKVDYYVTSGGTALVEDYVGTNGTVIMTTVYHADNNDIRATHFCGARNHPRMISQAFDADSRTLSLGFVDVANLQTAADYHSRGIDISLLDEDNLHVTFLGLEAGKESSRVFALKRVEE